MTTKKRRAQRKIIQNEIFLLLHLSSNGEGATYVHVVPFSLSLSASLFSIFSFSPASSLKFSLLCIRRRSTLAEKERERATTPLLSPLQFTFFFRHFVWLLLFFFFYARQQDERGRANWTSKYKKANKIKKDWFCFEPVLMSESKNITDTLL